MKRIISVLLVILWMMIMFILSGNNGEESTKLSSGIVSGLNLEEKDKDSHISFIVRKTAHFLEYAVLSLLIFNSLKLNGIGRKILIYSIVIAVLFAISDEVHQLFVPGRTGMIADVLLDSSSVLFTNAIMYYLYIKAQLITEV